MKNTEETIIMNKIIYSKVPISTIDKLIDITDDILEITLYREKENERMHKVLSLSDNIIAHTKVNHTFLYAFFIISILYCVSALIFSFSMIITVLYTLAFAIYLVVILVSNKLLDKKRELCLDMIDDEISGYTNASPFATYNGYFNAVKDMLLLEEDIKPCDYRSLKYICKGIIPGENLSAKNGDIVLNLVVSSYKDCLDKPYIETHISDRQEYILLPETEDKDSKYYNFMLRGVVRCQNNTLDFSSLDSHLYQILKSFLYFIEDLQISDDEKLDFRRKIEDLIGKENVLIKDSDPVFQLMVNYSFPFSYTEQEIVHYMMSKKK